MNPQSASSKAASLPLQEQYLLDLARSNMTQEEIENGFLAKYPDYLPHITGKWGVMIQVAIIADALGIYPSDNPLFRLRQTRQNLNPEEVFLFDLLLKEPSGDEAVLIFLQEYPLYGEEAIKRRIGEFKAILEPIYGEISSARTGLRNLDLTEYDEHKSQ